MALIDIVLILVLVGGWLAVALTSIWGLFDLRDRTAEEVADYLVPVDMARLESILDPAVEYAYRLYLSKREFRHIQLRRVHQLLELVNRISRNALILIDYANTEYEKNDPLTAEAAEILRTQAVSLRLYSLGAGLTLRFWLLVRLRAPGRLRRRFSLPRLQNCCGVPVLATYRDVKNATIALYAIRLPRLSDQVAELL